ncbi:MAG: MCE family protein [Balneolaceae bacterium]|nr:MAG: MCE family protein [Balneolaceae bacterium]
MKFSNEAKVGITVLLAVLVAIIGFRFMRDIPIFRQAMQISAVFERADGLSNGSLVYIKGVRVGSVSRIQLREDARVGIQMRIDSDIPIPRNSTANLTSLGIVEGKSIVIELGTSTEYLQYGDELEGIYTETMMEVLGQKGEELGDDVSNTIYELNQFLRQLNATLDDDTRATLDQTLRSTMETTGRIAAILEGKQDEINIAIDAGSRMLSQLDTLVTDSRPRVDSLMVTVEQSIRDLEQIRLELEITTASLNEILDKINNGEGTIGRLLNDPSMYENLESLTLELNNLVKGINENPGRYLRHMSIIDIF